MSRSDQLASRLRAEEPPWSELRERRVLAATLARRERRGGRPMLVAAGTVALAAAAIAAYVRERPRPPIAVRAVPERPRPVPEPPRPAAPRQLVLADGSRAVLGKDAAVAVERSTAGDRPRVVVDQSDGEVTYHVAHDPRRPFVVRAGGVEVRVVGTVFTVGVRGDRVAVSVAEGVVEVRDGARLLRLGARDEIVVGGPPRHRPRRSADEIGALLARADAARQAGDLDAAAQALEKVAARPDDGRLAAALFTLGRVQRGRDRTLEAADAFARAAAVAPAGPLAEDALAEAARACRDAGPRACPRRTESAR